MRAFSTGRPDRRMSRRLRLCNQASALVTSGIGAVWAAAGSIDTDLSFLSLLELYGTEIPERRMPARRVVEAFDVVEHV